MISCLGRHTQHPGSAGRLPGVSLTLFLVAILVFAWPRLTSLLQYDRAAMLSGEFWRLATCQWTHWNLSHVVWDSLMFLVLGALCERACRTTFVVCIAASAVLIPLAGVAALPQMHYYRGLSGLDSALLVLLAVQVIRAYWSQDRTVATAAALGLGAFALKTVYECMTGSIIFVQPESMFTPVPLAHVVGGAIGLAIAVQGGRQSLLGTDDPCQGAGGSFQGASGPFQGPMTHSSEPMAHSCEWARHPKKRMADSEEPMIHSLERMTHSKERLPHSLEPMAHSLE